MLDAVRGFAADGTLSHVEVVESPAEKGLGLTGPDGGRALAKIVPLNEHEVAEMRVVGEFHFCLALTAMEDTPQATYLCWEILTAIALFRPSAGWISDVAYSPMHIGRVAPVRRALFSDGGDGYLLTASELARVVENV